ncbi:hypothetical protein [Methylobacterium sp. JK268]
MTLAVPRAAACTVRVISRVAVPFSSLAAAMGDTCCEPVAMTWPILSLSAAGADHDGAGGRSARLARRTRPARVPTQRGAIR